MIRSTLSFLSLFFLTKHVRSLSRLHIPSNVVSSYKMALLHGRHLWTGPVWCDVLILCQTHCICMSLTVRSSMLYKWRSSIFWRLEETLLKFFSSCRFRSSENAGTCRERSSGDSQTDVNLFCSWMPESGEQRDREDATPQAACCIRGQSRDQLWPGLN